jgi:toxin ParE1/3/4
MALTRPERAQQFVEMLDEKFSLLAENPYLGRTREEFAPGLRSFPAGRYLIFYRPIEEGIEVARVVSSSRDLPPLFED